MFASHKTFLITTATLSFLVVVAKKQIYINLFVYLSLNFRNKKERQYLLLNITYLLGYYNEFTFVLRFIFVFL